MLYPGAARVVTLYDGLLRIDEDLAAKSKAAGCPHCGGPLDFAVWERHPRGLPKREDRTWWRLGMCCRRDGCRRRVLPPSALFLGRKVFFGAVILVSVASQQRRIVGVTADKLCKLFGMSRETLKRWISFFRHDFPESWLWKRVRGRISAEVRDDRLPDDLLAQYDHRHGPGEAALAACLTFLASAAFQAS